MCPQPLSVCPNKLCFHSTFPATRARLPHRIACLSIEALPDNLGMQVWRWTGELGPKRVQWVPPSPPRMHPQQQRTIARKWFLHRQTALRPMPRLPVKTRRLSASPCLSASFLVAPEAPHSHHSHWVLKIGTTPIIPTKGTRNPIMPEFKQTSHQRDERIRKNKAFCKIVIWLHEMGSKK